MPCAVCTRYIESADQVLQLWRQDNGWVAKRVSGESVFTIAAQACQSEDQPVAALCLQIAQVMEVRLPRVTLFTEEGEMLREPRTGKAPAQTSLSDLSLVVVRVQAENIEWRLCKADPAIRPKWCKKVSVSRNHNRFFLPQQWFFICEACQDQRVRGEHDDEYDYIDFEGRL